MALFSIVLIPQIKKTLTCKNVDGISPWIYILTIVANIVALWYAILIEQVPLQVKYIIGLSMGVLSIWVFNKYKK